MDLSLEGKSSFLLPLVMVKRIQFAHLLDLRKCKSLEEALKEIESNHKNSRMGTLLESAISAKQDAISLQLKYYEKILEFQTECDSLRKFVIILSIVPLFYASFGSC